MFLVQSGAINSSREWGKTAIRAAMNFSVIFPGRGDRHLDDQLTLRQAE
jgi:hypothetical protein